MADNYGDENKNVNQGWITTLTIERLPLAEKTLPCKFWFGKNQMFAEVCTLLFQFQIELDIILILRKRPRFIGYTFYSALYNLLRCFHHSNS